MWRNRTVIVMIYHYFLTFFFQFSCMEPQDVRRLVRRLVPGQPRHRFVGRRSVAESISFERCLAQSLVTRALNGAFPKQCLGTLNWVLYDKSNFRRSYLNKWPVEPGCRLSNDRRGGCIRLQGSKRMDDMFQTTAPSSSCK